MQISTDKQKIIKYITIAGLIVLPFGFYVLGALYGAKMVKKIKDKKDEQKG